MEKVVLAVQGLNKKIKDRHIIKDLSFKIREGEVCGFIGANGAGKTTTMRMLLGLTYPTSGEIMINNLNLKQHHRQALSSISGIIEAPSLFPYFTAKENLIYRSRLFKQKIDPKHIDWCLEVVGLENVVNKKVKSFSLGMRQRLGIAMCIVSNPKLVILDEPINGLDPKGVIEVRNLIKFLSKEKNISFLISSHLISELEQVADNVVIIEKGAKVIEQPIEYFSKKQSQNLFELEIDLEDVDHLTSYLKEQNIEFKANEDNKVVVTYNKKDIPKLYMNLYNENIPIYTVHEIKDNLETSFLRLLEGEKQ